MANVILGVFSEKGRAEDAIYELEAKGYSPKDMSILMKDRYEAKEFSEDTGVGDVVGDTVGGATTGAVLGGLAGLAASLIIPGLGAFFIGGPIATVLGLSGAAASTASGAATGALAGGLLGALTSTFGLSDEEAKRYETRINEGGILIAVPARVGEESEVEMIMSNMGADNIKSVEAPQESSRGQHAPAYGSEAGVRQPAYFNEVSRSKKSRKNK